MKELFLILGISFCVQQCLFAQCNAGSYTVSGNAMITNSCIITGDLTLLNGSTLNVDLTGAAADTFVVRGNILLQGNAVLWIHSSPGSTNDQFIVSNSHNNQRTITTKDSSRIQLENIEFRTQEGNLSNAASIYMSYDAEDKSILYVNHSWLDTEKAWLLFNLKNNSTLLGYEPRKIPTEIYIQDAAQISLHGANTEVGIWLNFESITDTLNLPADQTQNYTWHIGRGEGGLNTQWYLEVDTVQKVGYGAQVFPTAQLTINGAGFPATGELKVALMFANSTDTIKNLQVGLQNTTIANGANGRVTLNNVQLGPIAWQLYALMNENLYIKNSIVNEIGIAGPSSVTVDSSLLQLAVLAAVGIGGSSMTINNSEIWNQAITASNNSTIILNNCKVTGSAFSTTDAQSDITVNGGCFFQNPVGCTQATMVSIATGQPYCNPFIPSGFPQNLSPATVTFIGVNNNCTTDINETESINKVAVFPNPVNDKITISNFEGTGNFTLVNQVGQIIYVGQSIQTQDFSFLQGGVYFLKIETNKSIQTLKVLKN